LRNAATRPRLLLACFLLSPPLRPPPRSTLFPYTTLFRSAEFRADSGNVQAPYDDPPPMLLLHTIGAKIGREHIVPMRGLPDGNRSEEHTSELQSRENLVCRLLLEKKKKHRGQTGP